MKKYALIVPFCCMVIFTCLLSFTTAENNNIVNDTFLQTNRFRKSKGLQELSIQQDLNWIAQKHSEDMAAGRVAFGHDGFNKRNVWARKSISFMNSFAENVAYGQTSGSQVVGMWKNSPGHRRNMLGPYKYIGIGIAKDRQGRIYYTQVFAG